MIYSYILLVGAANNQGQVLIQHNYMSIPEIRHTLTTQKSTYVCKGSKTRVL